MIMDFEGSHPDPFDFCLSANWSESLIDSLELDLLLCTCVAVPHLFCESILQILQLELYIKIQE